MAEPTIRDFHAHIYFDADRGGAGQGTGAGGQRAVRRGGRPFPCGPVGPHPRGSVQMTVPTERFGEVATWLAVNRAGLTIFAHASTGDDRQDHTPQCHLVRAERAAQPVDFRLN